MIAKNEYIEYLLSTPFNYTCTNMADHKPNRSHDVVSDFLRRERFKPADLWAIVQPYIDDTDSSAILVDDSVQDKRYSNFIDLVKKQYSGNEHGTIEGIGLVNFVHSASNDGDFWPIDYRIYHPDTDGKTKNDHFEEMFLRLITHKHLKARRILFDSWYASVTNLKLIHRQGWTFFTTLKSNRLVSVNRDTGYQHLDELILDDKTSINGLAVKLKERGRPLGLSCGKKPRFGSLPTSEQGGLPYGAAEFQLYARIQDPPCFTCLKARMEMRATRPISKGLSTKARTC